MLDPISFSAGRFVRGIPLQTTTSTSTTTTTAHSPPVMEFTGFDSAPDLGILDVWYLECIVVVVAVVVVVIVAVLVLVVAGTQSESITQLRYEQLLLRSSCT
jgi:hypothetical protein